MIYTEINTPKPQLGVLCLESAFCVLSPSWEYAKDQPVAFGLGALISSVKPLHSSCLGSLGSRQDRSDVGQGILCQEWEEHCELLEGF